MLNTAQTFQENSTKKTPLSKGTSSHSKSTLTNSSFKNKRIEDFFSPKNGKENETNSNINKQNIDDKLLQKKRLESLLEKVEKPKKKKKENNKTCTICRDGGNLIMCDSCPRSFHLECLKLKEGDLPEGEWYCMKCVEKKKSSVKNIKMKKKINTKANKENISKENNKKEEKNKETVIINDKELYDNAEKYLLTKENIHKLKGDDIFNSDIPINAQTKMIYIYDFLFSFSEHIQLEINFTLNDLYNALYSNSNIALYEKVLKAIVYIFISDIKSKSYDEIIDNDSYEFNALIKLISQNVNMLTFINECYPELIYRYLTFKNANESLIAKLKDKDVHTLMSGLSSKDKTELIDQMINFAYETDFLRDIIIGEIEKKNETKKTLRDYEEEAKNVDSRIKELERQEQFTQPLLQIEKINIKLSELDCNETLTRSEISKLRKQYEKERDVFRSELKEIDTLHVRKGDIASKIEKIKKEIYKLNRINGKYKYLGCDYENTKYYFFHWNTNTLYLKTANKWTTVTYTEENKDYLLKSFSQKGKNESALYTALKALLERKIFTENKAENDNIKLEVQFEESDIIKRILSLEENFSAMILKEYNTVWESEENRNEIKEWIANTKEPSKLIQLINLFYNRLLSPYENVEEEKTKMILDDDDAILDINDTNSLINHSTNELIVTKINKKMKIAKNRMKIFSKEEEVFRLDNIYKDFLNENSFVTMPQVIIAISVLEALYNELIISRDKDTMKYSKNAKWDDACMICKEYGNLICCEKCPNVIHLFCAGLTKVPDVWYCEDCERRMKNRRITRSCHMINNIN